MKRLSTAFVASMIVLGSAASPVFADTLPSVSTISPSVIATKRNEQSTLRAKLLAYRPYVQYMNTFLKQFDSALKNGDIVAVESLSRTAQKTLSQAHRVQMNGHTKQFVRILREGRKEIESHIAIERETNPRHLAFFHRALAGSDSELHRLNRRLLRTGKVSNAQKALHRISTHLEDIAQFVQQVQVFKKRADQRTAMESGAIS